MCSSAASRWPTRRSPNVPLVGSHENPGKPRRSASPNLDCIWIAASNGVDASGSFTRESYDAAALIALAMAAGGEASSTAVAENVLAVANAPGEPILPGELGKAMEILANGGEIDYVGATNVELIGPGEAAGTYREYTVTGGDYETVQFR